MNLIQRPWKSRTEFVRKKSYSETEIKEFQQAETLTYNLIKDRKTEFAVVVQFMYKEILRWRQQVLFSRSLNEIIIRNLEINSIEEKEASGHSSHLDKIFGLWKGRGITLDKLREQQWGKRK